MGFLEDYCGRSQFPSMTSMTQHEGIYCFPDKYSKSWTMRRREEIQVNVAGFRRNIKNLTHNYSNAQIKVREATSNDHWGPSSTLMSEIADLTYNVVAFTEIMQMIWKRLNDHGKNWRHVYKALLLLEYLIKTGSEKVAQQCRENIYAIQTLRDFQYFEDGKDPGLNVREKAKQLGLLLKDEERLRNERARALKAKERFAQAASAFGSDVANDKVFTPVNPQNTGSGSRETWNTCSPPEPNAKPEIEFARPQTVGEEELQLQLALAMSRDEAEQEEQKRRSDDVRLKLALTQSEKEFKQTAPSSSHLADLLEIDPNFGLGSQPPLVDPWGMPISAPTTMAPSIPRSSNDPWSVSSSPSLPTPSSQSATPCGSVVASDPWAPAAASGPPVSHSKVSEDPWRTVSPKIESSSPATPPIPSLPAKNNDPWAPGSPDEDEFAAISNRNTSNHQGSCTSPDMFDLTSLENGLTQSGASKATNGTQNNTNGLRKTPQSFLGENSSLVNLDKLITTPAVPPLPITAQKTSTANPFGGLQVNKPTAPSTSLYPNTYNSGALYSGDPFQPVQTRSSGLPQPLMPQPNPFLS